MIPMQAGTQIWVASTDMRKDTMAWRYLCRKSSRRACIYVSGEDMWRHRRQANNFAAGEFCCHIIFICVLATATPNRWDSIDVCSVEAACFAGTQAGTGQQSNKYHQHRATLGISWRNAAAR